MSGILIYFFYFFSTQERDTTSLFLLFPLLTLKKNEIILLDLAQIFKLLLKDNGHIEYEALITSKTRTKTNRNFFNSCCTLKDCIVFEIIQQSRDGRERASGLSCPCCHLWGPEVVLLLLSIVRHNKLSRHGCYNLSCVTSSKPFSFLSPRLSITA